LQASHFFSIFVEKSIYYSSNNNKKKEEERKLIKKLETKTKLCKENTLAHSILH